MSKDDDRFADSVGEQVAREVLATLDGASARELSAFHDGLALADWPARDFASAIWQLAGAREEDQEPGWLPYFSMRTALRHVAAGCSHGWAAPLDFAARLQQAEQPFWVAVREALAELEAAGPLSKTEFVFT